MKKIDTEKLKTYMAKFLPQYMIPKYIIQLKSFWTYIVNSTNNG